MLARQAVTLAKGWPIRGTPRKSEEVLAAFEFAGRGFRWGSPAKILALLQTYVVFHVVVYMYRNGRPCKCIPQGLL